MYRILIADDEGLMLESLKSMILRNFPDTCEVVTAKTGRAAIEQAEVIHPDIIFMDIQMPGINGIEALKEIRKNNPAVLMYIISAYDKFDYAKEAISINVEKYLMKPITKRTIVGVVTEAIQKVEEVRQSRSARLKVQEKLETVVPIVENSLIGTILTQENGRDARYYQQLLDISEEYAYMCVFQFGEGPFDGKVADTLTDTAEAQRFVQQFRATLKSFMRCFIGSIMTNRIAVFVPYPDPEMGYEERIATIELTRRIVKRLNEEQGIHFRCGIGRVRGLSELHQSYQEAIRALQESSSSVAHTSDIVSHGFYEGNFPIDTEQEMFSCLTSGDMDGMCLEANRFFDWMLHHYPDSTDNIRLKVLEYVLWAEKLAFHEGAMDYGFESRSSYLTEVISIREYEDLRAWFLAKMKSICKSIATRKEMQSETVVSKAKNYIDNNYMKDISLDDVSREVDVSPYYFSKLLKEEAGVNFIDYLTKLRIVKAKQMLSSKECSMKEISGAIGYTDPNYFSRIFKKQTGMTPREYREKNLHV